MLGSSEPASQSTTTCGSERMTALARSSFVAKPRDLVARPRFQSRRARACTHQHDRGNDGKQNHAENQCEKRDLVLVDAAMRGQDEFLQRQRRLLGRGSGAWRNGADAPQGIRRFLAGAADAHSSGSSGSCPACPFASAGCRHLASPRAFRRRGEAGESPRIGRLYSQAESRRKSPDRERGSAGRQGRAAPRPGLFRACASRAMSSTLMRESATPNSDFGVGHGGQDDLEQKIGAGIGQLVIFDGSGGAQNVIGGNASAVAGELVAAARSANAAQDPAADERLQNGFKVPWRQAVTRGKRSSRKSAAHAACIATSITAATARTPLRGSRGIEGNKRAC